MYARIHTAAVKYPECRGLADCLLRRPDFELFARRAECDSAEEALCWLLVGELGGTFGRISHARLGWKNYPIVDATGTICLTGMLWPTLYVERPEPMVFFPQVRIQTRSGRCRVDMNVAIGGSGRSRFFAVEVNGSGHRGEEDAARPDKLRMPVVNLAPVDLRRSNLIELILQRYYSSGVVHQLVG